MQSGERRVVMDIATDVSVKWLYVAYKTWWDLRRANISKEVTEEGRKHVILFRQRNGVQKRTAKEYKTIEGALKAAAKNEGVLVVWDENGNVMAHSRTMFRREHWNKSRTVALNTYMQTEQGRQ